MNGGGFMKRLLVGLIFVFAFLGVLIVTQFEQEVEAKDKQCIQLITYAKNPAFNQCKEFPTPCEVPYGWILVDTCN